MHKILLAFAVLTMAALPVRAESLATNVAQLLAVSKICGLSYDRESVLAWVKSSSERESRLDVLVLDYLLIEETLAERSAAEKTAFCDAAQKTAKSRGFVK